MEGCFSNILWLMMNVPKMQQAIHDGGWSSGSLPNRDTDTVGGHAHLSATIGVAARTPEGELCASIDSRGRACLPYSWCLVRTMKY